MGNNPTNYIDPSGLRRCTPQEAAFDFEACDQNRPLTDSSNLFNYNVIPGSPGGSVIAYLQVNYQTLPWRDYAVQKAPHYPVLVPVRHPLNLNINLECYADAVKSIYTSSKFSFWEVNARNILAEIHGVITDEKEWALRDAIGIAYNPYNRQAYNRLPSVQVPEGESKFDYEIPFVQRTESFSKGSLDLLTILLSDNQNAVTTTGNWSQNPGQELQRTYEFSLIVAYGVDKGFFYDTSHGSVDFRHRPDLSTNDFLVCGTAGPAFFYLVPYGVYPGTNQYRHALTSAELEERKGIWPEWGNYPFPSNNSWLTGYPPYGCSSAIP